LANIEILNEIDPGPSNSWRLTFQRGIWHYGGGRSEEGYRFMYRRDDGSLQAARGQARIDTLDQAQALIDEARHLGWDKEPEESDND